jgi:hypothetical protein
MLMAPVPLASGHQEVLVTRRLIVATFLLIAAVAAPPLMAHDELGYTGTIQSVDAGVKHITIAYRESGKDQTVVLTMTAKTTVTRDKKKVAKTVLVAGMNVKVEAFGCEGEEVDALAIQITSSPAK